MIEYIIEAPVIKGWSGDKKFTVTAADGRRLFLRISPKEKYERRKNTFEMMKKLFDRGVPMCEPVEFGLCDDGAYTLLSYIEGKAAEELIPTLDEKAQYSLGIKAGQILKEIHSLPAPREAEDWETRFNRKLDRKLHLYEECPIKHDMGESFIRCIEENRKLLKDRPQVYQHGDYHIGNMMAGQDGKLYIIDFDRDDYGDPWEEFNRIVWSAQVSPMFASGTVNGYFDGEAPEEFLRLLMLYTASNTLSSIPWAVPYGDGEIQTMKKQADEIYGWYSGMSDFTPSWYTPPNAIS